MFSEVPGWATVPGLLTCENGLIFKISRKVDNCLTYNFKGGSYFIVFEYMLSQRHVYKTKKRLNFWKSEDTIFL